MQFDEFDKKAREAADHHHPAYHEQAWGRMEKLLNRHLPQKEDNRRRFIFFFLLLLGLGGIGLLITKPRQRNKTMGTAKQIVKQEQTTSPRSAAEMDKAKLVTNNIVIETKDNTTKSSIDVSGNNTKLAGLSVVDQHVDFTWDASKLLKRSGGRKQSNIASSDNKVIETKLVTGSKEQDWWKNHDTKNNSVDKRAEEPLVNRTTNPAQNADEAKKQIEPPVVNKPIAGSLTPVINDLAKIKDEKKKNQPLERDTETKNKPKSKKNNSFFFTLSAGPDVSFVSNDKPGTTKLVVGGGIGYSFRNKITIRTGFYSGRKIYSASPDAYHPPASFYSYYPYLEKVDANCKVYEIPLSISYNFSGSSKHSFFASAGISSYIMKNEEYNYFYKYYPTGPTLNSKWAIKNENKHFFSGLTLSGGYHRNISKHVSFTAEPYIKLPLSGLGYGKVKLNSGGVLFSVGINPFTSKKDKPSPTQ